MTQELEELQMAWQAAEAAYVKAVARQQSEATDVAWKRVMEAWQRRSAAWSAYEQGAMLKAATTQELH